MAYELSLNDIDYPQGYELSFPDLSASQELEQKAYENRSIPEQYNPQIQEEFSNPTQFPGFEKLSPEEQKQRIAWSAMDPANQTSTGGFVPPGSYESPITRGAASFIPTAFLPEAKMFGPAFSGIMNALNRVGHGVMSNIAYESPNIKSLNQLKNVAQQSAIPNLLLESIPFGLKNLRGASEIYNPSYRFGEQKANEIANEYQSARALQKATYKPVFDKYGDYNVTFTPKKYLSNLGIERTKLYPESKKIYDEFMKNPSFQNLHNLQSKIGGDIRNVRKAGNKPLTTERFEEYRNNLNDSAHHFLGQDENALSQYKLGGEITKNLVEPFRSTPTLRQIVNGKRLNPTPNEIANSIKKGREKIVGESGNNIYTAIPSGHALERHMNDINKRLGIGETLQSIPPEFGKKFISNVPGIIQSKPLNNFLKIIQPGYYIGGRAGISQMINENS